LRIDLAVLQYSWTLLEADAKSYAIVKTGTTIDPAQLSIGEWGVVANPNGRIAHSMVGIGSPVYRNGEIEIGANSAIQVDQERGGLYIGNPAKYLQHDNRALGASNSAQSMLYVRR
jgi:hypothetical protein